MVVKILNKENLPLPKRGSEFSAGYDIVAMSDPNIVGKSEKIGDLTVWRSIDYIEYATNIQFEIPSIDIREGNVWSQNFSSILPHLFAYARSSIRKYNLILCNSVPVLDFDFRGNISINFKYVWQPEDIIVNESSSCMGDNFFKACKVGYSINQEKIYKKGDRIAQLIVHQVPEITWEFVNEINETNRSSGGFGSTGT